ncbi:uncharacterized protein LOC8038189 isoform X2 [Ixodes scapularis]|uniref:uncharacterized protein LOC8038189 isoform X2 n=1 Tax=Ixodes scapularis TaxID=6945 RepID=UPI001C390CF1|nr:uncharacterized protein LOC8038189 isoform X2 [Ixodes scapularis]
MGDSMGDSIPLHAVAYAQEGSDLDGGAIILIPQDCQQMLLGDALLAGPELLLGQLQPLTIAGEHGGQHVLLQSVEQVMQRQAAAVQQEEPPAEPPADPPAPPQEAAPQGYAFRSEPVVEAPPPTRAVSRVLRVRWLDELLAKKCIACPVPGCPQTFSAITSVEKHYLHCMGVDGSGLEQCPYCEAHFLSHCNALHEHILEEHPTRRALVHSSFNERSKRVQPFRRRSGPRPAGTMAPPPPPKRPARPPGGAGASTGAASWDWENRRRTYSRSFDEPMGPTSDIFKRREEDDPLQLPKAMLNRDITLSSEELMLDEVQLQEGAGPEGKEEAAEEVPGPEVDTIRLESVMPAMRDIPKAAPRKKRRIFRAHEDSEKGFPGRGVAGNRHQRLPSELHGTNSFPHRSYQVIVKSPNTDGANALLRDPQVLQTLTNIATGTSHSPPMDPPSVVAVHSTAAEDGHYIQTEQALGPRTLRPAEVDRFFGGRVDCSCQTDDLPEPPPPQPAPQVPSMPFPPAILKRQRGLPQRPPTVAAASCAPRPLAVSIVCSSHNSSSSDEDEMSSREPLRKVTRLGSDVGSQRSATEQATPSSGTVASVGERSVQLSNLRNVPAVTDGSRAQVAASRETVPLEQSSPQKQTVRQQPLELQQPVESRQPAEQPLESHETSEQATRLEERVESQTLLDQRELPEPQDHGMAERTLVCEEPVGPQQDAVTQHLPVLQETVVSQEPSLSREHPGSMQPPVLQQPSLSQDPSEIIEPCMYQEPLASQDCSALTKVQEPSASQEPPAFVELSQSQEPLVLQEQSVLMETSEVQEPSVVVERSASREPPVSQEPSELVEPSMSQTTFISQEPPVFTETSESQEPPAFQERSALTETSEGQDQLVFQEPSALVETSATQESPVLQEPSAFVETSATQKPPMLEEPSAFVETSASQEPPMLQEPSAFVETSATQEPPMLQEPSAFVETSASQEPPMLQEPSAFVETSASQEPPMLQEPSAFVETSATQEQPVFQEPCAFVETSATQDPPVSQEPSQLAELCITEGPFVFLEYSVVAETSEAQEPALSQEPSAFIETSSSKELFVSQEPSVLIETPSSEEPPMSQDPSELGELSISQEPAQPEELPVSMEPRETQEPPVSQEPSVFLEISASREPPLSQEKPVSQEDSVCLELPITQEPLFRESQILKESLMSQETPSHKESLLPQKSLALQESPVPQEPLMSQKSQIPQESLVLQEPLMSQVSNVPLESAVPKESLKTREPLVFQESEMPQESLVSQESEISQESRVPQEPLISQESEIHPESLVHQESQVQQESLVLQEPLVSQESEMPQELLVPQEPLMSQESEMPQESLVLQGPLVFQESLVPKKPLMSQESGMSQESLVHQESLVLQQPLVSQESEIPQESLVPQVALMSQDSEMSQELVMPQEPPMSQEPSVCLEETVSKESSVSLKLPVTQKPLTSEEPPAPEGRAAFPEPSSFQGLMSQELSVLQGSREPSFLPESSVIQEPPGPQQPSVFPEQVDSQQEIESLKPREPKEVFVPPFSGPSASEVTSSSVVETLENISTATNTPSDVVPNSSLPAVRRDAGSSQYDLSDIIKVEPVKVIPPETVEESLPQPAPQGDLQEHQTDCGATVLTGSPCSVTSLHGSAQLMETECIPHGTNVNVPIEGSVCYVTTNEGLSAHADNSAMATDSGEATECVVIYETTTDSLPSLVEGAVVSEEATASEALPENTALRESPPHPSNPDDMVKSSIEVPKVAGPHSEAVQSDESFPLSDDNLPESSELVICLPEEVNSEPDLCDVDETVAESSRRNDEIASDVGQRSTSPHDVEHSSTICKVHDSPYERQDIVESSHEGVQMETEDSLVETVGGSEAGPDENNGTLRTCYIYGDDADSQSSCEALQIVESLGEEEVARVPSEAPPNGGPDRISEACSGNANDMEGGKKDTGHFLVLRGGRRVAASIIPQIPASAGFDRDFCELVPRCDVPRIASSKLEVRLETGVEVRLEPSMGLDLNASLALKLALKLKPKLEVELEPESALEPTLDGWLNRRLASILEVGLRSKLGHEVSPDLAVDDGIGEDGGSAEARRSDFGHVRGPQRRQQQPPPEPSPRPRECPGDPSDQDTPKGQTPEIEGVPDKVEGQQSPGVEEGKRNIPDAVGCECTEPPSEPSQTKRSLSSGQSMMKSKHSAGSACGDGPNTDQKKDLKDAERGEETADEQLASSSEECPVFKREQRKKRNPPKRDPMEGYASPEEGNSGRLPKSLSVERGRRQKATPSRLRQSSTSDGDDPNSSKVVVGKSAAKAGPSKMEGAEKSSVEKDDLEEITPGKDSFEKVPANKNSGWKTAPKRMFPDEDPSKRLSTGMGVGKQDSPKRLAETVATRRGRRKKDSASDKSAYEGTTDDDSGHKDEDVGAKDTVGRGSFRERSDCAREGPSDNVSETTGHKDVDTKIPRKRGRPRKSVADEDVDKKIIRKGGRPRKNVTDKDVDEKSPRKRGRPRKNTADEDVDKKILRKRSSPRENMANEDVDKKIPRKRGRPRKNTADEDVDENILRKRGSPRENMANEDVDKKIPRKRGRPRKITADEVKTVPADKASVPNIQENVMEGNSKVVRRQFQCRKPLYQLNLDFPDEVPLVCSACKESFAEKDVVARHILHDHYYLARVNDERPLSAKELRSALRLACIALGHLECRAEGCGASFNTPHSYLHHMTRKHREMLPPYDEAETPETDSLALSAECHGEHPQGDHNQPGSSRKRGAALRAMASFRALGETVSPEDTEAVEDTEKAEDSASDKSLSDADFSCPEWIWEVERRSGSVRARCQETPLQRLTSAWKGWYVETTKEMFNEWVEHLDQHKTIGCPTENCPKTFTTAHGLKYHHSRCGKYRRYKCVHCKADGFFKPETILEHLRGCVPERPVGDPPDGDHPNGDLPDGDPSGSSDDSPDDTEQFLEFRQRGWTTTEKDDKPLLARLQKWMIDFQEKRQHWQETLFPSWRPKDWVLLEEKEAEVYLPRQRESPRLRWQTLWRTARPPETSPAWRRLGLFKAVPPEEGRCHATFFAGGAIWAGDWCPTPPRSQDGTPTPVPQWVALACCPDPEVEHPLSDIGSEVGLLQVWGLGPLQGHSPDCSPRLGLALAHDFGFVADLRWCPSGCWEAEDKPSNENPGLRRLGLVALACGDGAVRILSVPVPEDLPRPPEGGRPLYRVGGCSAVLRLGPGLLGHCPATRVAWDPHNKHRLLAAGYGDGRVALFDLVAKGPLLGNHPGEPLWVLQAHVAAVMGLAFNGGPLCPHLSTASLDQEAKVWPLERPGVVPTAIYRKGPMRSLDVSPHWNGIFVCGEESVVTNPALCVFKENGYHGFANRSLAAHMCTVWVSPSSGLLALPVGGGGQTRVQRRLESRNKNWLWLSACRDSGIFVCCRRRAEHQRFAVDECGGFRRCGRRAGCHNDAISGPEPASVEEPRTGPHARLPSERGASAGGTRGAHTQEAGESKDQSTNDWPDEFTRGPDRLRTRLQRRPSGKVGQHSNGRGAAAQPLRGNQHQPAEPLPPQLHQLGVLEPQLV